MESALFLYFSHLSPTVVGAVGMDSPTVVGEVGVYSPTVVGAVGVDKN